MSRMFPAPIKARVSALGGRSRRMSSDTTLNLDLKVILPSLCSNIQDVMNSWYHAQKMADIVSPHLRSSFTPLRTHLQVHWESIRSHLQKYHEFAEDVALWRRDSGGGDTEHSCILEDLSTAATQIFLESQRLLKQSTQGKELLSFVTPQLSEILRKARKPATDPAFIEAIRVPDELETTAIALAEIHNNLCLLQNFWTVASETCRRLLNHTEQQVDHLGQIWKEWQQEIQLSIVSITRSMDAVAIEPPPAFSSVAPAPLRRVQRRRASASFPVPNTRKMSWSDGDGVPKSCWGFAFGDWKRK